MQNKIEKIGVIGAGAWGTALAIALASTKVKTILWAREEEVSASIRDSRENKTYLPSIKVPDNLGVTHKFEDLSSCEALLIVCPAQFTRSICKQIKEHLANNIPLILCAKGIEQETLMLQSEIVEEELPSHPISILSGPSFADEVGKLLPASLNLACKDLQLAQKIKNTFESSNLSIHVIDDIIGAQIGGIIKNIIAIGCGIASGLNLGSNVHAALIATGIKEASILANAIGGKSETLLDFCGIGDMVLTCSSKQSRNFSFGLDIGQGKNRESIVTESNKAVEGYVSAKPLYELTEKLGISLPLCTQIYEILYEANDTKSILEIL